MTTNDILKLIDAGFNKEEIFKLDGNVGGVPTPTTETPVPEQPTSEPNLVPEEPKPAEPQPSGVTLSNDQFKTLLQQLNVNGASMDVPPEVDMKAKLAEHFKEVTIGK